MKGRHTGWQTLPQQYDYVLASVRVRNSTRRQHNHHSVLKPARATTSGAQLSEWHWQRRREWAHSYYNYHMRSFIFARRMCAFASQRQQNRTAHAAPRVFRFIVCERANVKHIVVHAVAWTCFVLGWCCSLLHMFENIHMHCRAIRQALICLSNALANCVLRRQLLAHTRSWQKLLCGVHSMTLSCIMNVAVCATRQQFRDDIFMIITVISTSSLRAVISCELYCDAVANGECLQFGCVAV